MCLLVSETWGLEPLDTSHEIPLLAFQIISDISKNYRLYTLSRYVSQSL
jgi:hypothetical protein